MAEVGVTGVEIQVQALVRKILNELKEKIEDNNSCGFSNVILLVVFDEKNKKLIAFYDALVRGFVGEGVTDVRCMKIGQSTPDTYSIYPLPGLLDKDNPQKDVFRKILWVDNYPPPNSMFCVVRPRIGIDREICNQLAELSTYCRSNEVSEFLITPAWIGGRSRTNKSIGVIEWQNPFED